jgi:predicted aspartyl protease
MQGYIRALRHEVMFKKVQHTQHEPFLSEFLPQKKTGRNMSKNLGVPFSNGMLINGDTLGITINPRTQTPSSGISTMPATPNSNTNLLPIPDRPDLYNNQTFHNQRPVFWDAPCGMRHAMPENQRCLNTTANITIICQATTVSVSVVERQREFTQTRTRQQQNNDNMVFQREYRRPQEHAVRFRHPNQFDRFPDNQFCNQHHLDRNERAHKPSVTWLIPMGASAAPTKIQPDAKSSATPDTGTRLKTTKHTDSKNPARVIKLKKPDHNTPPAERDNPGPGLDCPNKKFFLPVVINDKLVTMKIDSGCHDSIISSRVWQELGRPQLDPVPDKRYSATGTEVVLKGQFIARVQYAGTIFELPVQVSDSMDTRSLMGRRWFPTLNLDWNGVFHCTSNVHPLQEQTEEKSNQELQMKLYRSQHFYIQVKVEGVNLMMMLDTGATQSIISSADWEKIGKPELKPTQIVIRDTSNKILPLTGQCTISCEYNGQKAKVPVFVYNGQHYPLIGTNWFPQFKFDFNNIFAKMTFNQTACKTKPIQSSSSTEKTLVPEKISVPEPDVKEIQEELKLPEIKKK